MSDQHIKMETTGTQYDEDHHICIDKKAKEAVTTAIRDEIDIQRIRVEGLDNAAIAMGRYGRPAEDIDSQREAHDLLDLLENLRDEIRNLPVCE